MYILVYIFWINFLQMVVILLLSRVTEREKEENAN